MDGYKPLEGTPTSPPPATIRINDSSQPTILRRASTGTVPGNGQALDADRPTASQFSRRCSMPMVEQCGVPGSSSAGGSNAPGEARPPKLAAAVSHLLSGSTTRAGGGLGGMFIESLLPRSERPHRSHSIDSFTGKDVQEGNEDGEEGEDGEESLDAESCDFDVGDIGGGRASLALSTVAEPGEEDSNCQGMRHALVSEALQYEGALDMEPGRIYRSNSRRPSDASRASVASRRYGPQRSLERKKSFGRRSDSFDIPQRILDRDAPFGQSRGHWHVHNTALSNSVSKEDILTSVSELFLGDWYHTFLDAKFSLQMMCFAVAFIACFVIFGLVNLVISKPCGLNLEGSFVRAYLLALETMMTIGYGVPDPYMQGCWQGAVVLTMQSILSMLMTACLIGVIFQGISRPQARACTVLFSEQAVIRCINGAHYLMFRICDLRTRHALIEAHVRCYCIHRHPMYGFQTSAMRLEKPDDELGAPLLLTLPFTVVHRIDGWSPLSPQFQQQQAPLRQQQTEAHLAPVASAGDEFMVAASSKAARRSGQGDLWRRACWPGVAQRQVDAESGNRDSCLCDTCGESFNTPEMLRLHCEYMERSDVASGIELQACHRRKEADDLRDIAHSYPNREEIKRHLSESYHEVVVLVEGIEPTTSSTLQARHSYVIRGPPDGGCLHPTSAGSDAAWDMDFAECCRLSSDGQRGVGLDLGRFHTLVPCPRGKVGDHLPPPSLPPASTQRM